MSNQILFINLINNFSTSNGNANLSIIQGKTYELNLNYPGDLTTGTLRGEIRTKYLENNGTLLAEFVFTTVYDIDNNKTAIKCSIDAIMTATIPSTKYQGGPDLSIKNAWVYDVEYEENDTVIELFRGFVQVIPETTGV